MRNTRIAVGTRVALAVFLSWFTFAEAHAQRVGTQSSGESVLILADKPISTVAQSVTSMGGTVRKQYRNADIILADVPRSALGALATVPGVRRITKDVQIPGPRPIAEPPRPSASRTKVIASRYRAVRPFGTEAIRARGAARTSSLLSNLADANVLPLFAQGITGDGVVVAVIDSGIRPGFDHLDTDGSVVGGTDLVKDGLGYFNSNNDGHGTFVAGLISANAVFDLPPTDPIFQAISEFSPESVVGGSIPMLGSAPLSSIFAVRVFGPSVNGQPASAPISRIVDAVEFVIERRNAYNRGLPGGLNIKVMNLSLGTNTLFAGRDLLDSLMRLMISLDIVPVVATGNAGPSSMTVATPATSGEAISVGGASFATNERILRSVEFGSNALGILARPSSATQTAWFSSRGPNADGRGDPDVLASAVGSFGQGIGAPGTVTLATGTSFAAPVVSGVAALLRQAFPQATAQQVVDAIRSGANSNLLGDGSGLYDQGRGLVDAYRSFQILSGNPPPTTPPNYSPTSSVTDNLQGLSIAVGFGSYSNSFAALKPGQRRDLVYLVPRNTRQVNIQLSNVQAALPPAQQNQLFGDDVVLFVHSAKTSTIGPSGDYFPVGGFTRDGSWTISDPEPGLLRVTVLGDWSNAGTMSGALSVSNVQGVQPVYSYSGTIANGAAQILRVDVPAGAASLNLRMDAVMDWSRYPTSDIDFLLFDPLGNVYAQGSTLRSPELSSVSQPVPGTWTIFVNGYLIPAGQDQFSLQVLIDGRVATVVPY